MGRRVYIATGLPCPDDPGWNPAKVAPPNGERVEDRELAKKLYVGNLPFSITEDELRAAFESHGSVESVNVIMDRDTGRPRGFAFVEMADASAADAAMQALDGSDMGGRSLRVNEAQDRRGGGDGGRGGGGGYGRGNRY